MNIKRIINLLPVGIYLWCIWYLRYKLQLVPISEITKKAPHLHSFQMYVSFKAILLLGLLFLSMAVTVSVLLKYMRLSEGVAWYFTFGAVGASLSVPAGIRRSTSMEWLLLEETPELQTSANVLTVVVVVLLFASIAVFISQIVTERYRVRNLLDEVLTAILSVYLLRLLTGIHNTWYLVAAVSVSVPGFVMILLHAYIHSLKSKLDEARKMCHSDIDEGIHNKEGC